ncbi:MAG: 3',5'-cyclic-nucleotide phosphodiesterase [Myxococcota bacterium]
MDLRVLGCHGGETPKHRTTAFLIDERLTLDAGALTNTLTLPDQAKLEVALVSHAHLDHIRDLATLADNRAQLGCPPLKVVAPKATIAELKAHFFNDRLWPDFTVIPSPAEPTIILEELPLEQETRILNYTVRAIPVNHTVEAAGFIIDDGQGSIGFSGDTGPTDRLWEALNETENLRALLMEVSFPDEEQKLATASGHHTPRTLFEDLKKLRRSEELPALLYHIKPPFQREVETQCAALKGVALSVLQLDDHFIL